MPALKLSKRDPELERGEKAAYNLCHVMHDASAANTWTVVGYRNKEYVVSARIESRGHRIGGPPLAEMATRAQLREAGRWSREVARHLARTQASATFWAFPGKAGRLAAEYVVQVEAVPTGAGHHGHTELMSLLRMMAFDPESAGKSVRRKGKRGRRAG